jgi:hypothetical protein
MILRALVIWTAMAGFAAAADTGNGPSAGAPVLQKGRAGPRVPDRDCCDEGYRFVYAEGWYGAKKVVAPVRRGELGDQVRLPGGTWVYCQLSCEYTLRKQTLDFWQGVKGQEQNVPSDYPRKDFYIDDWGHRRGYLF